MSRIFSRLACYKDLSGILSCRELLFEFQQTNPQPPAGKGKSDGEIDTGEIKVNLEKRGRNQKNSHPPIFSAIAENGEKKNKKKNVGENKSCRHLNRFLGNCEKSLLDERKKI
jgi:hypothetical protein